ncbi:glycosyltransferase family 4 protein [uncultured Clostridium sp.]|uniref:glycosyltransferase family 4 protein n=1 Tax=uncultured Clostridium sp. TaxID=59620 RepID=UPI00258B0998|nr:glycosyltransferase family 4 protein [uncultured Clostridium sp.]
MKKVLFVAHVVKKHFMLFHIPYLKWFKENGYETHVCARNDYENKEECNIPYCDKYYDLPFERFPFKFNNILVYKELKKIIDNNEFDIIHCHTPVGGVLARLAARNSRREGTKVIYTAHGFHFFKGASIINWVLFYPIEKFCARYTDVLITINQEDYKRAQNFKANKIVYVPGVGINTNKFEKLNIDRVKKREMLGILESQKILLSVGELSKRKNHEVVIKALNKLNDPNIVYIICGQGNLDMHLEKKAKEFNVNLKLLGFRKDILEICRISDIFVFPSKQEGLPVAVMEAMASGLPVVCSDIRGNSDLISNNVGGYLFKLNDTDMLAHEISKLIDDKELCIKMAKNNLIKIKEFDIRNVKIIMEEIYGGKE